MKDKDIQRHIHGGNKRQRYIEKYRGNERQRDIEKYRGNERQRYIEKYRGNEIQRDRCKKVGSYFMIKPSIWSSLEGDEQQN